jgi:hypothetical protein
MGSIAPTKTKNPPHFRKFDMCFAILFSMWLLTEGIKKIRLPMKYDIIPPIYDMVARTNRKNQGVTDFEAQAINTSGGTNPSTVSDIKKMVKIILGE